MNCRAPRIIVRFLVSLRDGNGFTKLRPTVHNLTVLVLMRQGRKFRRLGCASIVPRQTSGKAGASLTGPRRTATSRMACLCGWTTLVPAGRRAAFRMTPRDLLPLRPSQRAIATLCPIRSSQKKDSDSSQKCGKAERVNCLKMA